MRMLKRVKMIYSIVILGFLFYGLFLLIYPNIEVQWMYKTGGILFIGIGIAKISGYCSKDLLQLAFQHDLAMGIASIVIGCLMIIRTNEMIRIVTGGLGLFMLVEALLKIQTSIDARKIGMDNWWLILLMGFITAAIGGLLIAIPLRGTSLLIRLMGLTILAYGIMNLYVVQKMVHIFQRTYRTEIHRNDE